MQQRQSELNLNANLCLGLAEMKPDETPIHFDFEMKWSSEVAVRGDIPAKIEIRDHHFPLITNIGEKLMPQSKENQDVFIGKVLTLHGEADEQGKMQGEATLVLFMDEQQIKAKVFLDLSSIRQLVMLINRIKLFVFRVCFRKNPVAQNSKMFLTLKLLVNFILWMRENSVLLILWLTKQLSFA